MGFTALAQSAGGSAGGSLLNMLPFLVIIVIFYFLMIRPQQKKEKERKKMISAIQAGDKILTIGGMYGVVTTIKDADDIVVVKIADGTKVEFTRSAVQNKIVPQTAEEKKKAKK